MDDGFSTLVTIAADTDIDFWEKEVSPGGLDGGDAIETSTMHNTDVRTKAPRSLYDYTDSSITVAYDASVIDQIDAIINTNTTITITFPNGDKWAFYGYLKSFVTGNNTEGEQPEATVEIVATNVDPSDGSEAKPNFVSAAGTD